MAMRNPPGFFRRSCARALAANKEGAAGHFPKSLERQQKRSNDRLKIPPPNHSTPAETQNGTTRRKHRPLGRLICRPWSDLNAGQGDHPEGNWRMHGGLRQCAGGRRRMGAGGNTRRTGTRHAVQPRGGTAGRHTAGYFTADRAADLLRPSPGTGLQQSSHSRRLEPRPGTQCCAPGQRPGLLAHRRWCGPGASSGCTASERSGRGCAAAQDRHRHRQPSHRPGGAGRTSPGGHSHCPTNPGGR